MAEAILGVAVEKLSSLVGKELGLLLGLDQEKEKLDSMFTAIKATLQDAEMKQFSNEAIKNWLGKLKEVAYELDDIMEECAYEELRLEYQGIKCGLSNKVQSSCLSSFHPKHVVFCHKIAKRMKRISESGVIEWRQTTSLITEPQVYGREIDKNKIVDFLVGDASQSENLSVYPIIGLGGLGKTTLAQLVFNQERVVEHFEPKIWVCVSEDFSLKRMTKAIIEAISGSPSTLSIPPLAGPYSGYLVITDEEAEAEDICMFCESYKCSTEGDIVTCCFADILNDQRPKPFNLKDLYQIFKIHSHQSGGFFARSITPDGVPPSFLRKKGWRIRISGSYRSCRLSEAPGVDAPLREKLPDFNFPISRKRSPPVTVGNGTVPSYL
ncbi:hypothetical protein VNO78_33678 [Psophocarpus tetragonolobus]|uniref:Disease resistance protein RGA3 n=1 Tax=Psophocarpus tetragonolobus TaxID=3891 RepID=A0AAN9RQV8_PSOTE